MALLVYPRPVVINATICSVPVSIEVLIAIWPDEQVDEKVWTSVDAIGGSVLVVYGLVNWCWETDRCESSSTVVKFIIPVTPLVNAPSRRPNVTGGNPDPICDAWLPVAGSPDEVIGLIFPVSGTVEVIVVRCGDRRALLKTSRWLREIAQLFLSVGGPESGDPAVAGFSFFPVSGNPVLIRRQVAPDAADPDEVRFDFVPSPVAWNPLHVFAFGSEFWW